jgi:hypothetical protein
MRMKQPGVRLIEASAMRVAMQHQGKTFRTLAFVTAYDAAYLCRVAMARGSPHGRLRQLSRRH